MNKRTKALAIPRAVKYVVAKRDSIRGFPCCILCGKPAPISDPMAFSCCHYISRGQGGMGIEENILTLCPNCHTRLDSSAERKQLKETFREYLKSKYPAWNEDNLYYRKWV